MKQVVSITSIIECYHIHFIPSSEIISLIVKLMIWVFAMEVIYDIGCATLMLIARINGWHHTTEKNG
jgi:hypothetical protein